MHDGCQCGCEKHLKKGLDAINNGPWRDAKKCYENALKIHQDNAIAWANMGLCHDNLGDNEKALECYDKSLHYNPMNKHALVNKGCLLARARMLKEARGCFEAALHVDSDFQTAFDNRQMVIEEMVTDGLMQMIKPSDLKVVNENGQYHLKAGKDLIRTPGGNVIGSITTALLKRIVADFEGQGDLLVEDGIIVQPRVISAYTFESSRRDFFDSDDGRISNSLPEWLANDPAFQPTAGHPIISMYQAEQQESLRSFLEEHKTTFKAWNRYSSEERRQIIRIFQETVAGFSPAQKSVLINLGWPNGGQFVMTLMYLLGRCEEGEWAMAIFSRSADVCRITGEEPMGWNMCVPDDLTDEDREELIESLIAGYENECLMAKHYLDVSTN